MVKVLGVLFALAGVVVADTITFEGIAPAGGSTLIAGAGVSIEGFSVSSNGALVVDDADPGVGPSNGTSIVRPSIVGFFMTISRPGGEAFSLVSIDAVDRNNDYAGGETFGVSAVTASGGILGTTFTTPIKPDPSLPSEFSTYYFGGGAWDNVVSVTIGQSVRFMFDNVVTGAADPDAPTPPPGSNPVPEPGTCAMFGLALAGYAMYRRRRAA